MSYQRTVQQEIREANGALVVNGVFLSFSQEIMYSKPVGSLSSPVSFAVFVVLFLPIATRHMVSVFYHSGLKWTD